MRKALVLIVFIVLFFILVGSILAMPGDLGTNSPSYNESAQYYIDNAVEETGAVNIIAAILTDYRGFDTLGETIVLFTSIVAVASILQPARKQEEKEDPSHE